MASKIQSHNFYVAITPYKVQGVEDQYNELSVFTSYNENVHKFYVSLHAGWKSTFGHGTMIMGDSNPLTASTMVYVKESPRNSQKTINEIGAALELAKDIIAALFDDREWDKLRVVVQNVARFGYTDVFKEQAEAYLKGRKGESETNNENNIQNSTTMAQNVKAADLIGKTIVVGDNQATIVIKSVDGDKLSGEFTKDGKTTPMSFPVSQLQGMTEKGLWKMDDGGCKTDDGRGQMADVGRQTSNIKHQTSNSPQTSDIKTEADVQEVQDIVPVVTPKKSDVGSMTDDVKPQPSAISHQPSDIKPQTSDIKPQTSNKPKPRAKSDVGSMTDDVKPQPSDIKPQTSNKPKPKDKTQPSAIKHQPSDGTLTYETYQNKKGKTCAKIIGFKETDKAYVNAAELHGSASWINTKDGKVLYLLFGHRYVEAARLVCEALNAGKSFEDCKAIVNSKPKAETQTSNISPQPSTEKTYTQTELAEWLRKLNAGDPKAAKFFNDLAKAA